ncbi:MAG: hypothetical protein U1F71_04790 [Verrucomicrobiaceae bacterium]
MSTVKNLHTAPVSPVKNLHPDPVSPLINALDNDDVDGVVAINRVIDAYRHELGQPAQAAVLEAFWEFCLTLNLSSCA